MRLTSVVADSILGGLIWAAKGFAYGAVFLIVAAVTLSATQPAFVAALDRWVFPFIPEDTGTAAVVAALLFCGPLLFAIVIGWIRESRAKRRG